MNPYNPSSKIVLNSNSRTVPTFPITVKGSNNGTFGFGMVGALFPESMNGPFGQVSKPMPNNQEFPTGTSNFKLYK